MIGEETHLGPLPGKSVESGDDYQSGSKRYCWQTRKMSDKLQFVGAFGSRGGVQASNNLKFAGLFHYPSPLLPCLQAVSKAPALKRLPPFQVVDCIQL